MNQDYIDWNGKRIEYEWERTKRKTIGITITTDGKVKVKVPMYLTEEEIKNCVRRKGQWIISTLEKMKIRQQQLPVRQYQNGGVFFYLGKKYVLNVRRVSSIREGFRKIYLLSNKEENEPGVLLLEFSDVHPEGEEIKALLELWYRNQAKAYIKEKAFAYSRIIPCDYGTIRIKNQKTCWGSCSVKGNLNFNWRLMMAPAEIVDYVIVHELCHRLEMNHSSRFWALVEKQIPDFRMRRAWLKENSNQLFW
ncbi:MAG: SprT family zinc-dependent metalloprotease [Lachnospiraceae bacterium]|nr:SprT family zinc-dependent metalloprotease [Lachnospiraceae bacterium]